MSLYVSVSHDDFVRYLVGKAPPGIIKVARLGFEGKDTVVYATDYTCTGTVCPRVTRRDRGTRMQGVAPLVR